MASRTIGIIGGTGLAAVNAFKGGPVRRDDSTAAEAMLRNGRCRGDDSSFHAHGVEDLDSSDMTGRAMMSVVMKRRGGDPAARNATTNYAVVVAGVLIHLGIHLALIPGALAQADVESIPLAAEQRVDADAAPPAEEQRVGADGSGIYLNDSFAAADALGRLEPLVRSSRWREAAELLQEVSDTYGDKLIRRAPGYYIGLRRYVQEVVAGWPTEGREAYRSLYEREVAAALDHLAVTGNGSPADDLMIVERYFCTRAAFELAERVGQRAIEAGDLPLAEHVYRRLLDEHPDGVKEADRLRAMLAIVRALMGAEASASRSRLLPEDAVDGDVPDRGEPHAMPVRLSAQPPDLQTRVRWKGQDRPLREILTAIESDFSSLRESSPGTEWPLFGGNATRNRGTTCPVDELGVQWRFLFEREGESGSVVNTDSDTAIEETAQSLTAHPVVSGDLIYVQRFRELIALHRVTGEVAWRFDGGDARPRGGSYVHDRPTGWDAITVAEGRVYASLPSEGASYYGYGESQTQNELVCLEALTGRVIWRMSESVFAARFAEYRFDSSPIVEHGRLHIVGRRRRSFGFEDCYLFRVDARTGRLLTQTHVGSASTGTFGLQPATKSIPAWHGDTVYVCSHLGSVAAISAHTGAVRWVRLYERIGRSDGATRMAAEVTPWHYNPVLWTEHGLVILPMDASAALLLAPETGQTVQIIPRSLLGDAVTLLGMHDGLLCAAGRGAACYDVPRRRVAWSSALPEGTQLVGRGAWVGDRILLPTSSGLGEYRVADGVRRDLSWEPDGAPGNLVPLPDQLLVASARQLTAYVRKSEIWNALRAKLRAYPNDPIPALELAEVAMRGGETDASLDALEQAVSRAASARASVESGVRQRLFRNAMAVARTLADRGKLSEAELDRLLTVASSFPSDAREHLEYRLRFAHLLRAIGRPERSVRLYQQVLQDRSLRDVPVDASVPATTGAATFCSGRIDELIKEHGESLYAPFEQEADRLLAAAVSIEDEVALARVVASYPNSRAAPQALIARGSLLGKRGRPVEAVRLLIQAYHRYDTRIDKPALLKQIADTLEWAGRRADAFRWLTKASLEYPSAVILDREERVTFRQCRERLEDVRHLVEPHPPVLAPPVERAFEKTLAAPMSLLIPKFAGDPGMRWSRAYVYEDGVIRALDPRTGADLWPDPPAVRESVDLLTARDDVVVFSTSFEVFGVDPQNGRRIWTRGTYPKAADHAGADWEDVDAIRSHALDGPRLAIAFDGGRITMIDVRDGQERWSETVTPAPAGELSLGDRVIAYHALQNDRIVIALVSALDGSWMDAIVTEEQRVANAVFQTLDEQVILVTSQSVSAYDIERRALRWRVSTGSHFRDASVLPDLDAIYLSPDGRDLRKISLEDGRVLWELVGLLGRGEDALSLRRIDAQLLVTTTASIISVDAVSGMLLWRGTTPPNPRFLHRLMTRDFLITVNVADEPETPARAFFFDLRNASGVIPVDGAPRLGRLDDLRRILALDGALLYQTGPTTLHGFSHP